MLQPEMTIDEQRMVRPEEVRRRLGISERSFYTYAQKGILPTVKVGGGLRVKESDLRQILQAGLPLAKAVYIAKQYGTSKTTVARIICAAVPAQDRRVRVLTRAQAQQVLDLHRVGASKKSLAARFGVSSVTIGHIARGRTFQDLEGPRAPSQRLKPADVQAIRRLHRDGVASQTIAIQFGVSSYTVRRITTGRTWKYLESEVA